MSSDKDRIKELLNIAEVVGEYVELRSSGSYYKANCPFHKEKTPSFIVTPERGTYHCFGCGASGDIFSFIQEFEGLDFRGALKLLGDRAGVEITDTKNDPFKEKKDRLFIATEEATKFFENSLLSSKEALRYLKDRGVTEKTRNEWRLGYTPDEWRALYDHLGNKGISEKDMVDSGLIKKNKGKTYDTFRGRLMFPINDASGNVIAFSGRALVPTDKAPKYLNSPDTEIFNKSEVLYGLDKAGRSIRRAGYVIVVEGQFDLIMSHQAGIKNTVALSGTSVTKGHIRRLSKSTKNVLLAFDSDDAGIRSAYKTALLAFSEGMDVKIANLPAGKDPADCIKESVPDWKEILRNASHAILHSIDHIKDSFQEKRKQIKAVRDNVFPMLFLIESEMDRSYFLGSIADKLDIPINDVKADAERYIGGKKEILHPEIEVDRMGNINELIDGSDIPKVEKIIKLTADLLKWLEESVEPVYPPGRLRAQIDSADPEFAERVSEAESKAGPFGGPVELEIYDKLDTSGVVIYSNELVFRYKTAILEEKINKLQKKIKERSGEDDNDEKILSDFQQSSRELDRIRTEREKEGVRYILE